jgi:hypothetical protein
MPAHFSQYPHLNGLLSMIENRHVQKKPPATDPQPAVNLVESFSWPAEPTVDSIGSAIADALGIEIVLKPIPDELRHREISGLTTMTGRTAHIFIDADLSPINREQTIFHEYAHILHGDVQPDRQSIHLRSMFDDPIEKRAETTGMHLLNMLYRHRLSGHGGASEAIDFMTGLDDNGRL